MLLFLLYPFHESLSILNVFRYITFRTLGASLTAILFCMAFGPFFIRWVQKKQLGQIVRDDGPQSHLLKQGTPTMGGALILMATVVAVILWADLTNGWIWTVLLALIGCGLIGFVDDFKKVIQKNTYGLRFKEKMLSQTLLALVISTIIYQLSDGHVGLHFPFFKDFSLQWGWVFFIFSPLVIVGSSNAVNLTDGLDGLALGPTMTTGATFLILSYCAGHNKIAEYLQIPYVAGSGELAIFCGALSAACLGFLWFNTYPAQIFMGDTGSLALGGSLATVAIITGNEILLAVAGGIFVLEALSVMAQVASFKMFGKRVLKMAPIHHHYELKGWAEPKIIVRFWIISIILALLTLSTLKLR
jgi:phospho-N-acetylmuramoyl-pentapeptide-transferase